MITTIILCLLGWGAALFLYKELKKKFRFHNAFCNQNHKQVVTYLYPGSEQAPEMRNIVLRASGPFSALIGFQWNDGVDFYGFCKSDKNGVLIISTYLGKGACAFVFLCDVDTHIYNMRTSSTEEDQKLAAQATFPPHWWQRFM